jgi:hypothetical protein
VVTVVAAVAAVVVVFEIFAVVIGEAMACLNLKLF